MRSIATFFTTLALAFAQAAMAQEIPSRVGRLAFTEGPVSVYQDPELGWDKAYVNTPITSENSVWTDRGARAEMRVGGIAARLDGETQLDISRLDENDFDGGIPRGAVNLRVRYKERDDHITFNTPHALFVIETDGRYRLDVDEDRDQSRFTVLGGYAFMESSNGRIPIEPGRMVVVSGGGQYAFERAREDAFDKWAFARDQQWQDSTARRYVSSDMTGYEELDRYGQWSQDADYGAVWYPRVSAGWAPYRYGHWSYVRPWGYTWIDDQPWGYAPSHYGRWVEVNNRWGWIPGYRPSQPVSWAPALVGFFGGAGFSVSISAGAPVGWYPLAPWERYDPWYRASPTYVTRVNRYVVDRRPRWYRGQGDDWRHMNRDRAYTVVNRDVFVNRRAVQSSVVRVSPEAIRSAQVVSSQQVAQQVLPQRSEVVRYRDANRTNVAAPTVTPLARRNASVQQNPVQGEAARVTQQQQGAVVRPDFRRRSAPAVVAPAPAGAQPQVSAPAPQPAQPQRGQAQREQAQPENPMARRERPEQQQLQQQQQQQEQARRQQEQAQREQQQAAETQRKREEAAQRANQEQQMRAQQEQRRQQDAQRAAQDQQRAQQLETQRKREEAAQRAQQDQQMRAQQEQKRQQDAQRAAQEQQRAQQEQKRQQDAQRAAQEQQRAQQAQQQQQQQQAREAARQQQQQQQQQAREAARQQQQQQQPKEQPQPAANPNARGDHPRGKPEKDKDDKDKEKDKDKR